MSVPIIELRQYTLHEGQRDVLIDLFESEFIETQEGLGMLVVGTFRDLDRPDRFVWIRGYADMDTRAAGLNTFYTGPVWQKHRTAANATMIDSDDVLLLHARGDFGFDEPRARAPKGATKIPDAVVIATICSFAEDVTPEFLEFFDEVVKPDLYANGVAVCAQYVTEKTPNNFPRLPVRENEHVFVWFAVFANRAEYERRLSSLERSTKSLEQWCARPPEVLRLQPTARSAFPSIDRGAGDFDFLIGDWSVHHRRLKRRLVNDTEWIEFSGPASVRKFLAGMGNVDEITIDLPEGTYTGATVRLYNPGTRQWSIHWMDSRDPKMDPPMIGRFENGRGLFYGDDTFEGKPIQVRFIWTPISPSECRWEQAFSLDAGATWETNWIMSFTRQ